MCHCVCLATGRKKKKKSERWKFQKLDCQNSFSSGISYNIYKMSFVLLIEVMGNRLIWEKDYAKPFAITDLAIERSNVSSALCFVHRSK